MEAALRRVSCDGEDDELPGPDDPMLPPPPYDTVVSLTDRWVLNWIYFYSL